MIPTLLLFAVDLGLLDDSAFEFSAYLLGCCLSIDCIYILDAIAFVMDEMYSEVHYITPLISEIIISKSCEAAPIHVLLR